MFDRNVIYKGSLLSFCLEPTNMNSVLVIFIYVEQVFVQGRLNGVNITIRISQMSVEKSNFLMLFLKNLERSNSAV